MSLTSERSLHSEPAVLTRRLLLPLRGRGRPQAKRGCTLTTSSSST